MTMLACMLICLAAFVALALSLPRHHKDVLGRMPPPGRERGLRMVGAVLMAASLTPLTLGSGVASGIVAWFGAAALSGLTVMVLLTYRPRIVVPAALASLPLALGAIGLSWNG